MHANSLSVRVGHSERSMIGLTILAFQISPLPLGIPSFPRSPEFGDEGHHLFILQCHAHRLTEGPTSLGLFPFFVSLIVGCYAKAPKKLVGKICRCRH